MVGVIVEDMHRAAEFYRRLGVDVPDDAEDHDHVEITMSGLTFFLSTKEANARWDPARTDAAGRGYRIILEFYLETRETLDTKYEELTGFGYASHCAPYDVTPDTTLRDGRRSGRQHDPALGRGSRRTLTPAFTYSDRCAGPGSTAADRSRASPSPPAGPRPRRPTRHAPCLPAASGAGER